MVIHFSMNKGGQMLTWQTQEIWESKGIQVCLLLLPLIIARWKVNHKKLC